ncbi:hypothetical protein C8R43DRAFT_945319 [Mycena crocata]|nr:hypothetical protein C8R43DRAFT_945319 [Mycena crocata]
MFSFSFVKLVTAVLLMAGSTTAQDRTTGTITACQGAGLAAPCRDVNFVAGQCKSFDPDYNDKVRSITTSYGMLKCTMYEENCTNPGRNMTVPMVIPYAVFNVRDDLKNLISNIKCDVIF